tara:strand:- start:198 stop:332 length:135 start_codon:yes stop_codon:yes gene_type:complete
MIKEVCFDCDNVVWREERGTTLYTCPEMLEYHNCEEEVKTDEKV